MGSLVKYVHVLILLPVIFQPGYSKIINQIVEYTENQTYIIKENSVYIQSGATTEIGSNFSSDTNDINAQFNGSSDFLNDRFFDENIFESEYENKSDILQKKPYITRCCDYTIKKEIINCSSDEVLDLTKIVYNGTTVVNVPNNYFNITEERKCHSVLPLLSEDKWYVQLNGTLYMPEFGDDLNQIQPDNYCLHFYKNKTKQIVDAFICITPKVNEVIQHNKKPTLNKYGMIISMPFLLVTFFVYACIPELQNIHGKCLMCYVATLFTAYIFLVSVQLENNTEADFCIVAPCIIYFAFMVSFMWLNVMCIDIWWTFSGRRGFRGTGRNSERTRFVVYSIYAWGIPLIMLCITIALQFAPDLPDYVIRPNFGEEKCWFPDNKSLTFYFYGPILVIILSNLALFAYTSIQIYRVQRDTDQSMKHESQRHGSDNEMKQRYKLYLKLMLVFGVNWLMEIVSWLVSGPQWLWYVTDMCNALYGVFIFFIFVCKANVWKLCRKRYHVLMGRPYLATTYAPTSSTRSTAMSQTAAHAPGNGTEPDSYALTSSTAA